MNWDQIKDNRKQLKGCHSSAVALWPALDRLVGP
jgi:hypothetical protein